MCGTFTPVVPPGRLRIGSASGCELLTVVGGIVAGLRGTHDGSKPRIVGTQISRRPSPYCRKMARGFDDDDACSLNAVLSRPVCGNKCSSIHGAKSVSVDRALGVAPCLKGITSYIMDALWYRITKEGYNVSLRLAPSLVIRALSVIYGHYMGLQNNWHNRFIIATRQNYPRD
jgi:hypothetical protein